MIPGRATPEGTAAYARRFPMLPEHFRPVLGLTLSSIGIGTYLGEHDEPTDRSYTAAVKAALLGGINLIDTAVNYRLQRSERSIGQAIAQLISAGQVRREEIAVATKGGYFTFDGNVPPNPQAWLEQTYLQSGLIGPGELVDDSHCIAPRYLEAMIEQSRTNLGLETIDVYYLHNPESQLGAVERDEFMRRMRSAFELLEAKVGEGRIGAYGTATWNGYRADPGDREHLSLARLVNLAGEVGGPDHHFRVIQLPYNLAMPEALLNANQQVEGERCSILAAAKRARIGACASASLLQGRLTRGLPPIIAEVMAGLASDAQRSLQFVRSTPGVDVALVGMRTAEHVSHNLETARHRPASSDSLMKLFKRR